MEFNEETQRELEELFKTKLEEQYRRGLEVGVKTSCRVVLDFLKDGSKPLSKRIASVRKFCETPFQMNTQIEKQEDEGESNEG